MAVEVRGNTISQLLLSHMSPRPQDVSEGEISLFTPEDDMLLRDRVQSHGRHWNRIADEVEFSSPRTTLELRMRYDCLERQERNELAMLLEREYIHVDQPLDGTLEVSVPAERGEDAELALVRARDRESSDDDGGVCAVTTWLPGLHFFAYRRVAVGWRPAASPADGAIHSRGLVQSRTRGPEQVGRMLRRTEGRASHP
jgi:hypothetical protein